MGYGTPKISNKEILSLILDGIREELQKNGDFSGDSLAFYKFEANFSVRISLVARGKTVFQSKGRITGGEKPQIEEGGTENKPVSSTITASGTISNTEGK